MKKIILSFLALLIGLQLLAQQSLYTIKENSFESVKIQFNIPDLTVKEKKIDNNHYSILGIDGFFSSSIVGNPQLPILSKTIEIPLCEDIEVEVILHSIENYSTETLGINHEVYPAQMSYSKSHDGPIEFFKSNETYQRNEFYSEPLVRVEKVGVMRSVNLANIYVSPIRYNPVTRRIDIYRDFEVVITYKNADIPSTYEMKSLHTNGLFLGSQSVLIANPIASLNRDGITAAPVKYLIVAHSMFRGALDEFVRWKKRKGFLVEVAYTDDSNVGTTNTSIKAFIKSKYVNATTESPAPSYVLLVGDVAQIPTFSYSSDDHVSDLEYFLWTTGDNIPDCYYGRFSAQNITQLMPQIEKTLQVEQYTMSDPSYLGDAVLVAGTDSHWSTTHANGQINYLANNYVNTAYGYNTVYKHLYPASSQAATIRSELNAGVGYANYTAHCDASGWADPTFETNHISAMNNTNKYGFFVGNCCQSSKFEVSECFGEAITRTSKKGAVAYIGGSNNTYWDEDYYWSIGLRSSATANPTYNASALGAYDRLFHTHNEPYADWFTSAGAMITAGNMSVQSSTSSLKNYYWQIYNLLGDPSLMPYLSIPQTLNINCPTVLFVGTTSLEVQAVPYAYVALTLENELLAAAFADGNGVATLNFNPLTEPNTYEVTASAQNYVTAFTPIDVIVNSGPYVIATNFALSSTSVPKFNTSIDLDLTVKNVGIEATSNVYAKLHTTSADVTITLDSIFIGDLSANQEVSFSHAFGADIASYISDGSQAALFVTFYFGNESSQKRLNVTLLAPKFVREGLVIEEFTGNRNSVINPGETFKLTFTDNNAGHVGLEYVLSSLISNYTKAKIEDGAKVINSMNINQPTQTSFLVHFDNSVEDGEMYAFYYRIKKGDYVLFDTVYLTIGISMEDFESNSFTSFPWTNSTSNPWYIVSSNAYEGTYCARSKQNLSNNGTSELTISLNVTSDSEISYFRKVSSERDYDFFKFFIDGEEKERLSGTVNWGRATFPVSAGQRTFKFQYVKDQNANSGSDCAWIDNIVLPGTGILAPEDTTSYFPLETSIKENPAVSVLVYPNPAQEKVYVTGNSAINTITIYDINGRTVASLTGKGEETVEVDLNGFAKGFYLLKIQHANQTEVVKKLIKQ